MKPAWLQSRYHTCFGLLDLLQSLNLTCALLGQERAPNRSSCFKNGMLPIAVTKAGLHCQDKSACQPRLQRIWWKSSGRTRRPARLLWKLPESRPPEANKKLSVDLQSQEIRREGCEVAQHVNACHCSWPSTSTASVGLCRPFASKSTHFVS